MTRKEQIEQESAINATYIGGLKIVGKFSEGKLQTYQNGFVMGAEWADNNPKSPWISVNDDLPYKHKELIFRDGYGFCTPKLLIRLVDKESGTVIYEMKEMVGISLKKMRWDIHPAFIVTHWMPIPKFKED